jgi:tetratricopeptide (TPR) repeat protein
LLGFVFGIPRTLQHDIAPGANTSVTEQDKIGYQINTNLEQISDWLTKIIIGVGLVELGSIGSWLISFSKTIGKGFGDTELGQAYVLGVLVFYSGVGFLFGYLWTRLSFGLAVKEADKGLVERTIEKFEAEARADGRALQLVARQLSPTNGETGVSQVDLNAAVAESTRHARIRIFYETVTARHDTERRDQSIPVFLALIESDKRADRYHRNHAELGYALKDKSKPDWEAAEQALSKAIEVRDRVGDSDRYGAYEFNRAVCRIHLNRSKEEIIADFQKSATDEWVRTWQFDAPIAEWLRQNRISAESLGFQ